jgi:hypothetical protein
MQKNTTVERPSSGARAIALDPKVMLAHYRLSLLISLILSAAFALGLHIIFGF